MKYPTPKDDKCKIDACHRCKGTGKDGSLLCQWCRNLEGRLRCGHTNFTTSGGFCVIFFKCNVCGYEDSDC